MGGNISQAGCAGNLLHYHPLKVSSPRCHPQRSRSCVNFSTAENCKPWKFKGKRFLASTCWVAEICSSFLLCLEIEIYFKLIDTNFIAVRAKTCLDYVRRVIYGGVESCAMNFMDFHEWNRALTAEIPNKMRPGDIKWIKTLLTRGAWISKSQGGPLHRANVIHTKQMLKRPSAVTVTGYQHAVYTQTVNSISQLPRRPLPLSTTEAVFISWLLFICRTKKVNDR